MLPGLSGITPSDAWLEAWDGFELWLRAKGRSPKTIATRRSSVMVMARWATKAGRDPGQVEPRHMKRYFVLQSADRKGVGAAVLYQDLRSFWTWHAQEYQVPDPMDGITRPQGTPSMTPVLRPAQIRSVLEACTSPRDTAMVWLLLESGLRRFELSALDVADVDLRARTVTVRRGKGGKARVAVMGDQSCQALWRYLRTVQGHEGPLFRSRQGGRLTPGGISQLFTAIGRRAGIRLRPHAFRHTWAHTLMDAGASETNLMEVAGWSSRRMLDRYGAELKQERAIAAMRELQVGQIIRTKA